MRRVALPIEIITTSPIGAFAPVDTTSFEWTFSLTRAYVIPPIHIFPLPLYAWL